MKLTSVGSESLQSSTVMQIPDSNTPVTEVSLAAGDLLAAVSSAMANGDDVAAAKLLQEMETEYPGEITLTAAAAKCRALVSRGEWLNATIKAVRQDLENDHFTAAIGHFREAMNLSRGLPVLKLRADQEAEAESLKLLPASWRIAETLIYEATSTEPAFQANAELMEKLRIAKEKEAIANALHQADRAEFDGNIEQARTRLTNLLAAHPEDSRIADKLRLLGQGGVKSNSHMAVARTEPKTIDRKVEPSTDDVSSGPAPLKIWRTKIAVSNTAWDSAKSFVTLAATTAMLGGAAFLTWQHFSDSPRRRQPAVAAPVSPAPVAAIRQAAVPSDEQAWQLVKTSDNADSIRSFLANYPSSAHALRAKVRLSAMEWSQLDKTNVPELNAYIQAHPDSPYNEEAQRMIKDASPRQTSVVSPEQGLVLQSVRSYRAAETEIGEEYKADILDVPVIQGDIATIRCRPQVPAGAPALRFKLAKREGKWEVESVR